MATLSEVKQYALGDDDLSRIVPKANIFTYPYLKNVKHIDEIFGDDGQAIMLYLTENEHTGHWVGLLRKNDHIEFFDPYGEKPDDELKWISRDKREELDQDKPLLSKLLRQSELPVVYNKVKFQKDGNNIETCGRHVATRLLHKDLSLPEYAEMIKGSGMSPDEYVSRTTFPIIKK
jgi:hypothetical protein